MNVLVEEQCLRDIAKAIRKKNGKTRSYKPREMALAIESLGMQPTKKYSVYIIQSDNQVITATYNGKSYTSTFSASEGDRITFSIKPVEGYTAGTLNYTLISNLNSDVTVKATSATPIGQIEYAVPEGTTEITGAVVKQYKLNRPGDLVFPNSVKSIAGDAFYDCTALTSVSLPACTKIGSFAFYDCTALTSVSLPVCTSIGEYVFDGCKALTSVLLPACTNVGNCAFLYLNKLQTLILSEGWKPSTLPRIPKTVTVYNQDKTKKVDWDTMSWVNV